MKVDIGQMATCPKCNYKWKPALTEGTFNCDMSDSSFDFMDKVYPKLLELNFINGEIIPIENVTEVKIAKQLDMLAGIDSWWIKEGCGIIGLSSRVQWKTAYNTFTVRKERNQTGAKTELEKRVTAINSKGIYIYPYYAIQAYLTERRSGVIISLAIAKTVDIIEMINQGMSGQNRSNNDFEFIQWDEMRSQNYNIKIWEDPYLMETHGIRISRRN
jgi:hypothetical protein